MGEYVITKDLAAEGKTFRNALKDKQRVRRRAKAIRISQETLENTQKALALNKFNTLLRQNSAVKWLIIEELRVLNRQLENDGIESFVKDAEAALLMCIKGYRKATSHYNRNGKMIRTTEEYVGPDYQAAISFLKHLCPEKWGKIDGGQYGDTYNIINAENIDLDLQRLTRVAGSLLERKMIASVETNADSTGTEQIENQGSCEAVLQSDTD